jgi:hypothetical protein
MILWTGQPHPMKPKGPTPKTRQQYIEHFWSLVDVRGLDECWEWKTARTHCGYGRYWSERKDHMAHSFAYKTIHGTTNGLHVLHRCDNRACCNPCHLFLGTHQDNMRDMAAKHRSKGGPRNGSSNGHAKLTELEAWDIWTSDGSLPELAKRYNVSRAVIWKIKNKTGWKHIHHMELPVREPEEHFQSEWVQEVWNDDQAGA